MNLLLCLLLLTAGGVICGRGAPFVAPEEGPVPFRRDRVPLDIDTIMALSERLSVLASTVEGGSAVERRNAAQMLAVSLALDPVNGRSRKLIHQFENGSHRASKDDSVSGELRDWISQAVTWLESSEAGPDGNALAACLADVLAVRETNDASGEGGDRVEMGEWKGWVAPISRFEEPVDVNPVEETAPQVSDKAGILLGSATVSVPLWQPVVDSKPPRWKLAQSALVMTAEAEPDKDGDKDAGKRRFSLILGDPESNRKLGAEVPTILQLLKARQGDLPNGANVRIDFPDLGETLPKGRTQSFSAAAAVLASAAISGIEPDATILGVVDSSGGYNLPAGYWEQLRSLTPEQARRVILPAAAEEDLPSLLVMGEIGFFLDHEILLAEDFEQLLELSAKVPADGTGQVLAGFQAIRMQAADQSPGPFVAKSSVRRAFSEIAQVANYHASARMLAIQGAGDRPSFITRRVLFAEIARAIEPAKWLVDHGQTEFTPDEDDEIGKTYETCRSAVERLLRYSEKADHAAAEQALEMLATIRTLDRASRSRSDTEEGEMSLAQRIAYTSFLKAWKEFMAKLDPSTAEPSK